MGISRRQFLEAAAVGAVVTPALGAGAGTKLPTRAFGKTGMEVSILAFGSGSRFLMYQDEDQALQALESRDRPGDHLHRHRPLLRQWQERGTGRQADARAA